MKKEQKKQNGVFGKLLAVGAVASIVATNAMADAVLVAPEFALDDVAVVAGALLVGLAGFWAIRKGISLAR